MRRAILMLAALACAAVGAFTAPVYTNRYVSNGVTYSQFGGVKASNYVATAISDVALVGGYTGTVKRAAYASIAAQSTNALVAVSATNIVTASGPMNYRELTNTVLVAAGAKVDALETDLRDGRKDVAYAGTANYALASGKAYAADSIIDENGQYYWSDIAAMTNGLRAGNYAAVSNAAMNARSMTDLWVRGAPMDEGSWFVVDGYVLTKSPLSAFWSVENIFQVVSVGGEYQLNEWAYGGWSAIGTFALNESFSSVLDGHTIIGYTNVLAQVSQIPDVSVYATQQQATHAAVAVADAKISTNNAAFVSAVLAAPLAGADAGDLAELSEYGSYGTVGAALLALIAGLAALKRRIASAETALAQKANAADLPYAMVTPGEWSFSDGVDRTLTITEVSENTWVYYCTISGDDEYSQEQFATQSEAESALSLTFEDSDLTATRPSLPGHLLDRAGNLIDATTGNVTLTLPPFVAGKVRDMLVACTIGLDANDEPWSVIFQGADGEEISFKAEGDDATSATFPVPDAAGDWWYSLTERAAHVFAVALKQLQSVSQPTQTQGGS